MALRLSSAASKGTLLLLCLLVAEFSVGAGQKDFLTTEWTTPTNGVKAALRFPSITSGTNFSEFQIQIVVSSASINRIRIWMPPENQLLRLDLLDSKGKPVQKTSRG